MVQFNFLKTLTITKSYTKILIQFLNDTLRSNSIKIIRYGAVVTLQALGMGPITETLA